jgi:hypothetical protein
VRPSLIGGKLSDRPGPTKIFIFTASIVYSQAMFVIATISACSTSLALFPFPSRRRPAW